MNILLTRGFRVMGEYSVEVAGQTVNLLPLWLGWFDSIFSHSQGREVASRKAHNLENDGSNPSPAIPYSGGIRRRYCGSIGLSPQLR